ncbi:MAG: hypothetical protein AAGG75_27360 [Bacteroidota bacterium]
MAIYTPKERLIWEAVQLLSSSPEADSTVVPLSEWADQYYRFMQHSLQAVASNYSESTILNTQEDYPTASEKITDTQIGTTASLNDFLLLRKQLYSLNLSTTQQEKLLNQYRRRRDQLLALLLCCKQGRVRRLIYKGLYELPANRQQFESIIRKSYPVFDEDHIQQAYNDMFAELDKKINKQELVLSTGVLLNTFLFNIGIKKYIDKLPKAPTDHVGLHLAFRTYGLLFLEKRFDIGSDPGDQICRKASALLIKMIKRGSVTPPLEKALIYHYFDIIDILVQPKN